MSKKYSKNKYNNSSNINLNSCKYLGRGHSGKAYLMPNGWVLKIFFDRDSCKKEYDILKTVEGSYHFPKAYERGDFYIIREYVGGINVEAYLHKFQMTRAFVLSIANLIDDLKKLGFKKLNLRFAHVFVQRDGSLMLIDPRNSFSKGIDYPASFLKGLKEMGLLNKFLKILREERPDLNWKV